MKNLKNIGVWLLIIAYLVITFSFVDRKNQDVLCSDFEVIISDSAQNRFVSVEDVLSVLKQNELEIVGYKLESINTYELECLLNDRTVIKRAEIYKTINGKLNVKIQQRKPIVRIYTDNGYSFYIDHEGNSMPLSKKFTSHVLVASGDIHVDMKKLSAINCSKLIDKESENILCHVYRMANFIQENPFWRSQIEQVYVKNNGEFELIPRVGAHIIDFGDISDMEYKFKKLKAVYDKGFSIRGWNTYNYINLKYSNQVICSKR